MPFLRRLLSRNNGGTATSDDSSRPPHDEPPSYESNNGAHVAPDNIDEVDDLPPPAFDFPTSYSVGHHPNRESTGTLFIIRSDVQAHVRLLAAFERLRQKVEAGCAGIGADLDPKSRWSLFVNVAIYRLEMFLRVMSMMSDEGHTEQVLPPLDVAMALHAYMLQPLRYAEDKLRDAPPLCGVKRTLLSDVAFAINGSTFELPVNPAMQSVWTDLTNTPYDPLEYFATTETRMTPEIHGFPSIDVPWITPDKTGYAQEGFKAKSPDGLIYTHATLGIAKLASDVFRCKDDPLATLAGTVVSPWLLPEQPAGAPGARWVATRIARSLEIRRSDSPQDLANAYKWDRDTIEKSFLSALGMYKQGGINGILNCYIRGEPFSVDLVPLILREADFTRDLAKLGWFTPGKLDEDTATLDRIIARYHGFMDVVAANPPLTCIPTVDIELAWQTHLLKPTYLSDIHSEVGRLVDHDPAIEESALARLFDETSDAWMARYRVPYSLCACTASRTGGQTKLAISALRSHIRGSASTVDAPTRAEYSARGYPDNSATHPSELVCVTFVNKSDALRERQKRHKVAQARKKEAESGAVPPCVLAGVAGGAYLKPSLQSVCYGTSGYALNEEDGFVICARLADPATVLGGEGYGPHAVPGRAMSVAAFRAQAGVGLGTGWEGMALGAMSVGAGGFSM